jgi:Flp pilus assembly protein TadD
MVRRGARDEALEWLQKAARLGQGNPRFGYVYAVALHDMGYKAKAMATLKTALLRHRHDRNLLHALLSYRIEASDWSGALDTAETLAALDPHDIRLRNLLSQLRQRR